jgi:hypothetical protein
MTCFLGAGVKKFSLSLPEKGKMPLPKHISNRKENVMDLTKLKEELLDKGAVSCLPGNLPDYWLDVLLQDAEDMDVGEVGELILAVVIGICEAKFAAETEVEISYDDLFEYCNSYKIELALEKISRATEVKYEKAMLDTIFTKRDVRIWKEE